jgi:hypothetical protein
VKELMDFVASDDRSNMLEVQPGKFYSYFPTRNMRIPVDSAAVVNNGTVPRSKANRILKNIDWTMKGNYVQKNDLMVIDLLAHNNWKRPVYFAATAPASSYLNLAPYLQLEGLAYRLVPIQQQDNERQQETMIATDTMFNNVMNKFKWGGMEKPGMYLDNVFIKSCALNVRQRMGSLAAALIDEGKKDKAVQVLDKCVEVTAEVNVPYDVTMYSIALGYYQAGANAKANVIARKMFDNFENNLEYYYSFDRKKLPSFGSDPDQAQDIIERLIYFAETFKEPALAKEFQDRYQKLATRLQLPTQSERQVPQQP